MNARPNHLKVLDAASWKRIQLFRYATSETRTVSHLTSQKAGMPSNFRRPLALLSAILALQSGVVPAAPVIADAVEPSAGCVGYDDPSVTLSGTSFSRIYFGPPGYGETPAQDRREGAALLLLDAPICVKASPNPELDNNAYEGNVIVIQLAAVHIKPELLEKALGQRVTVRGSLFHSLTGHHRTPVLMDVYSVQIP